MGWVEVDGAVCPDDLEVPFTARPPVGDPGLGIDLPAAASAPGDQRGDPAHPLVVLGDSLSHGVTSGAVARPDLCWSALVAAAAGFKHRVQEFEPLIIGPDGWPRPLRGGIPVNIEALVRRVRATAGERLGPLEVPGVLAVLRDQLAAVERWWERGGGSRPPPPDGLINHQLGVYSFDLRDALDLDADHMRRRIDAVDTDSGWVPRVERNKDRAGERVLNTARSPDGQAVSMVDAARLLGEDGGIGTLVVALGGNNVLSAITRLEVVWSVAPDVYDLDAKGRFTVWRPEHFAAEYGELVRRVTEVDAERVVFFTIPHVTIVPAARGIGGKLRPSSRYFRFYARPWVDEDRFDPTDRHLTGAQARMLDAAVDAYNEVIVGHVRGGRVAGRDWWVLDLCAILDRLAHRRWSEGGEVPRPFDEPYPLPEPIADLTTDLFDARDGRITRGGLIGLDAVHPTTTGGGIVAHEVLELLRTAGALDPRTPGMNFAALRAADALVSDPPAPGDLLGILAVIADLAGLVRFLGDRRRT